MQQGGIEFNDSEGGRERMGGEGGLGSGESRMTSFAAFRGIDCREAS